MNKTILVACALMIIGISSVFGCTGVGCVFDKTLTTGDGYSVTAFMELQGKSKNALNCNFLSVDTLGTAWKSKTENWFSSDAGAKLENTLLVTTVYTPYWTTYSYQEQVANPYSMSSLSMSGHAYATISTTTNTKGATNEYVAVDIN